MTVRIISAKTRLSCKLVTNRSVLWGS